MFSTYTNIKFPYKIVHMLHPGQKYRLIAISFIFATLFSFHKSDDPDFFFHAATGKYIIEHGIPDKDPFVFTYTKPWINHEWLSDIIIGGFDRTFGPDYGSFLFVFTILFIAGLIIFSLMQEAAPPSCILLFMIPLTAAWTRISPRPHLIGALLALITLRILYLNKQNAYHYLLFFLIGMLWANTHAGFLIGPLLIALFLLTKGLKYTLISITTFVLGTLFNPYFFKIYTVPLSHLFEETSSTIPYLEWLPYRFGASSLHDVLFILLIIGLIIPPLYKGIKKHIHQIVISILFIVMTLRANRFFFETALIALPFSLINLQVPPKKYLRPLIFFITGLLLFIQIPKEKLNIGIDLRDFPVAASSVCNKIPASQINVFNPFNQGSYIIYKYPSKIKIYADPAIYSQGFSFVKHYEALLAFPERALSEFTTRNISCIIVDSTAPMYYPLTKKLMQQKDYVLVHIDDHFGVFVRSKYADLYPYTFKELTPITDPEYYLYLPINKRLIAQKEAHLIKKTAPVFSNFILGLIELGHCITDLTPKTILTHIPCSNKAAASFKYCMSKWPSSGLFKYLTAVSELLNSHFNPAKQLLDSCDDFIPCRLLRLTIKQSNLKGF